MSGTKHLATGLGRIITIVALGKVYIHFSFPQCIRPLSLYAASRCRNGIIWKVLWHLQLSAFVSTFEVPKSLSSSEALVPPARVRYSLPAFIFLSSTSQTAHINE